MPYTGTNGIQTYYERHGSGRPLVCIHGLTMDRRTWAPQVDDLAAEYEVITYDCRGHGKTDTGDPSEYTVSLLVEDLRVLIEELELEKPVLCGHSYGGIIAAEYGHQYPDEVAGIIFADARTDLGEPLWERVFIRLHPAIQKLEQVLGEKRVESVRGQIVKRLEDADRGANPEVDNLGMTVTEYMGDASDEVSRDVRGAYLRAGRDYIGTTPTAFDVPVLYLHGEYSANVIAGKAEQLRRAPTDVRVREFEDADHFVSIQSPDEFNDELRDFLADAHGQSGDEVEVVGED